MGFWGTLGKIALPVAGIAAAPFTGGTSLLGTLGGLGGTVANGINAAMPALGALGQVASGASQGMAQGRQAEANIALQQQQLRNQTASDAAADAFRRSQLQNQDAHGRAGFGLAQQQFRTGLPETYARQAMKGGLQANLQDVNIQKPAGSTIPSFNITGGLRPSAMGPEARAAGQEMARKALEMQLAGGPPELSIPELSMGQGYQAPTEMAMPQSGWAEKLLGGVGIGGSVLGALGSIGRQGDPADQITPTRNRLATPPQLTWMPKSPDLMGMG